MVEKKGKGLKPQLDSKHQTGQGKMECNDRLCPVHGDRKLKMRGRTFEGVVVKKLTGRVVIQFERMLKLPKYERYEKRKTKIHARLPDCMKNDLDVGDLIEVSETRPVSKMIHFVVSKVVRKVGLDASLVVTKSLRSSGREGREKEKSGEVLK